MSTPAPPLAEGTSRPAIIVLSPGPRTTIQDLGRPGHAHLGIPPSGATDKRALTLANRLVGNAEGAAALETTITGPVLRLETALTFALAGAEVEAQLDGRPVAMHAPVYARAGQVLTLGSATRGLRTYLAVRGGLQAPLSFGSASSDQLTGLGPAPLATGDNLAIGGQALAPPEVDVAPVRAAASSIVVRVVLGPRDDAFAPDAVTDLLTRPFTVSPQVDRIGARLLGPQLTHRNTDELRSEGLVTGSLQVPPSGHPILLLADHPTTGGYPVIAVAIEADLPLAAQLRPGDGVRFRLAR